MTREPVNQRCGILEVRTNMNVAETIALPALGKQLGAPVERTDKHRKRMPTLLSMPVSTNVTDQPLMSLPRSLTFRLPPESTKSFEIASLYFRK
jgi:hypothetical protein